MIVFSYLKVLYITKDFIFGYKMIKLISFEDFILLIIYRKIFIYRKFNYFINKLLHMKYNLFFYYLNVS